MKACLTRMDASMASMSVCRMGVKVRGWQQNGGSYPYAIPKDTAS